MTTQECNISSLGFVYILTNSDFISKAVKIGRTKNILQRLIVLNTGVAVRFELYAAQKVEDAPTVERCLHDRFQHLRRENGEFFDIDPNVANQALQEYAGEDVTELESALIERYERLAPPEVRDRIEEWLDDPVNKGPFENIVNDDELTKWEQEKRQVQGSRSRGPNKNFLTLDIPLGATLHWWRRPRITAEVVKLDPPKISSPGLGWTDESPSAGAAKVRGLQKSDGINGYRDWAFGGETLETRWNRLNPRQ